MMSLEKLTLSCSVGCGLQAIMIEWVCYIEVNIHMNPERYESRATVRLPQEQPSLSGQDGMLL